MAAAGTEGRQAIRTFAEHEHEDLAAGICRIHELGEELAAMSVDQRAAGIHKVLHWVEADLKPHIAWEEHWLFPLIDRRTHTSWATRYARFDHHQIVAQAERLSAHSASGSHFPSRDAVMLIADLSALETLLRATVEREERFLLPLLESEAERWEPDWRD